MFIIVFLDFQTQLYYRIILNYNPSTRLLDHTLDDLSNKIELSDVSTFLTVLFIKLILDFFSWSVGKILIHYY